MAKRPYITRTRDSWGEAWWVGYKPGTGLVGELHNPTYFGGAEWRACVYDPATRVKRRCHFAKTKTAAARWLRAEIGGKNPL